MEEFNLKRALAGEPLITRSGDKVFGFKVREGKSHSEWPYAAEIIGQYLTFTKTGRCGVDPEIDNTHDLFMAEPELKEGDLIEVCAPTGSNYKPCIFLYKEKNNRVIVVTHGYEDYYRNGTDYPTGSFGNWRMPPKQPQIEITVKINGKEAKLSDISDETLQNIKKLEQ